MSRKTSASVAAGRRSAASAPPSHSSIPAGSRRAMRSMSAARAGPRVGVGQAEQDGGRAAAPGGVDDLVWRQLDAEIGDANAGERGKQRRAEDPELVPIARQRRHQHVRPPRRVRHGADDAAEQAAQHRATAGAPARSTGARRATPCRCDASAAAPRRGPGRAAAGRRRCGRSRVPLRWRRSGAARPGPARAARRARVSAPSPRPFGARVVAPPPRSTGSAAPGTGAGRLEQRGEGAVVEAGQPADGVSARDRRRDQLQPAHVGVAVDRARGRRAPASPRDGAVPRRAACRR